MKQHPDSIAINTVLVDYCIENGMYPQAEELLLSVNSSTKPVDAQIALECSIITCYIEKFDVLYQQGIKNCKEEFFSLFYKISDMYVNVIKKAKHYCLNAYISYKNTGGNLHSNFILLILVPTAKLYAVLGQYDNAIKTCEEALFYRPGDEIVLSLLSEISSNDMPQN